MAEAEVGDDVFGDDPTVNRLQEKAAALFGKEAGLFVPTGTMGNQICIRTHTKPGDAILIDGESHIAYYEVGGPAVLSQVITDMVPSHKGVLDYDAVAARIRPQSDHTPGTTLLCLENTHNRAGGTIQPISHIRKLSSLAHEAGMKVHLDGARIFNASIASGTPVSDYAGCADSLMFCFSKGLACPVGSMVLGTREFINRAHRVRKLFGGGMRQAGVLAACGMVALDTMVNRLADDHHRAKVLAKAINDLPGLKVDMETVQTNMVFAETDFPAKEMQDTLQARGIRILAIGPKIIRMVLHNDVDDEKLTVAIDAFRSVRIAGS